MESFDALLAEIADLPDSERAARLEDLLDRLGFQKKAAQLSREERAVETIDALAAFVSTTSEPSGANVTTPKESP